MIRNVRASKQRLLRIFDIGFFHELFDALHRLVEGGQISARAGKRLVPLNRQAFFLRLAGMIEFVGLLEHLADQRHKLAPVKVQGD